MEVVFPLHHLLNQEFPVRKKREVWIHNTRHFQFLSLPLHQWSEGASSCQLWVPATLGEGSSSQGFIQLPKSFPVWMRGHDLSDSIGSCTERGSSTPFCRCNELPALAFPQLSKLPQTQNTSPTGRKNSIWIKIQHGPVWFAKLWKKGGAFSQQDKHGCVLCSESSAQQDLRNHDSLMH